jgi:hypothetical protein
VGSSATPVDVPAGRLKGIYLLVVIFARSCLMKFVCSMLLTKTSSGLLRTLLGPKCEGVVSRLGPCYGPQQYVQGTGQVSKVTLRLSRLQA